MFWQERFWRKQYQLENNGFRSYEGWYHEYIKRRDKYIYYLGTSVETCGNQMFQLKYDKELDCFHVQVRKEYHYTTSKEDKYLEFDVNFKQKQRGILIKMLKQNQAMNYRILRRGKKWYLQVIFRCCFSVITNKANGCIGVDFNHGFLATSETNADGNLVDRNIIKLQYHGGGNRAKSEMQLIVHHLVKDCVSKKKALIIEDLNFNKKKSGIVTGRNHRGKSYNRMLHLLDYSRFQQLCKDISTTNGVDFSMVNPRNTSRIAKSKYCSSKKLNIHIGAAYVIARRGQGYQDNLVS